MCTYISYSDLIRWAFEKLTRKKWDVYSSLEWNGLSGANECVSFAWRQNEITAIALGRLSQQCRVPAMPTSRSGSRWHRERRSQLACFPTSANRAKHRAPSKHGPCAAGKVKSHFQRARKNTIAPSTFLFLNPLAWICCYQLVVLVAKPETWWKGGHFRSRGGISLKIWSLKIVFCYPSKTWWLRNQLLWKNVNFLWCICT